MPLKENNLSKALIDNFRVVDKGEVVDGLKVRNDVPNTSSIRSTFTESETLPGIREVKLSAFDKSPPDINAKTKSLAKAIKQSGEINPLIVAIDKEGAYILEGANRFDALKINGAKSFPALVVKDTMSFFKKGAKLLGAIPGAALGTKLLGKALGPVGDAVDIGTTASNFFQGQGSSGTPIGSQQFQTPLLRRLLQQRSGGAL
jgi:hypothetical protein